MPKNRSFVESRKSPACFQHALPSNVEVLAKPITTFDPNVAKTKEAAEGTGVPPKEMKALVLKKALIDALCHPDWF